MDMTRWNVRARRMDTVGVKRDMSDFLAEIAQVRQQSVTFDRDEHTVSISAVGIVFKDWKGDLYRGGG